MNDMQIGGCWSAQPGPAVQAHDFVVGGFGLSHGAGVAVHEDERCLLAIVGQIFDLPMALAMHDQHRLDTAYGLFSYVRYDKVSGAITIGTDRFGFSPIYHAVEDGRFIFGTSLGHVKSQLKQRSPDYDAWEELMVLGEVIGDKSTVKEIKRLLHGTRIEIRDGRISFPVYWVPELPEPSSEAAYIEGNNRLLGEALALTAPNPLRKVVLLSGGEDSRRLALSAVKEGLPVDFYTQESVYKGSYKIGVDRDVKLAAKVAQVLGRPHFIEPMPDDEKYLQNWHRRNDCLGFECIAHEWLLPLAQRIEPGALIYDGIVGDITTNGHYFKAYPSAVTNYRDLDAMAEMICGEHQSPWLGELRRHTTRPLKERVRELLASYPDSPHRLTFYFILNHTRRKIACVSQLFGLSGHYTCYPFLYYPFFLHSLSIDPARLITHFYQRECMEALGPEVLSVPTTREKISDDWVILRGDKEQEQEDYLLTQLQVSERAFEMFPSLRLRYHALRALSGISMKPLRAYGWQIPSIAKYSYFLAWLDKDAAA